MSRISEDVWERLSNEGVKESALWTRRAAPDVTERLFAALDAGSKRHLLVSLLPSDGDVQDNHSRGLSVVTRELTSKENEAGRYIDITCVDSSGHDALDLIGGEIAERIASGNETASECVVRVLSKWRRFWGQSPKQILSREAQVGLFTEIWFLFSWLVPARGALDSVRSWRGSFGSRHDFEWQGHSVEVKATTSTRGLIHRINGIDQLDPPEQGKLQLFSVQLREEVGAEHTLPRVVLSCRSLLEAETESQVLFDSALVQSGYSPAYEQEYEMLAFRVVQEGLFDVRDDFPRLTLGRFVNGIPPGIEHIDYEINLNAFQHLRVAQRPDQMPSWP
jgi:hypothetical protein